MTDSYELLKGHYDRIEAEKWKSAYIATRFFLATDNDSHWYVVPVEKRDEWEAWLEIDSDDERAWSAPKWAIEVGGSPGQVTFTDYTIGG